MWAGRKICPLVDFNLKDTITSRSLGSEFALDTLTVYKVPKDAAEKILAQFGDKPGSVQALIDHAKKQVNMSSSVFQDREIQEILQGEQTQQVREISLDLRDALIEANLSRADLESSLTDIHAQMDSGEIGYNEGLKSVKAKLGEARRMREKRIKEKELLMQAQAYAVAAAIIRLENGL